MSRPSLLLGACLRSARSAAAVNPLAAAAAVAGMRAAGQSGALPSTAKALRDVAHAGGPVRRRVAVEVVPQLVADTDGQLQVLTLFTALCRRHPGRFQPGQRQHPSTVEVLYGGVRSSRISPGSRTRTASFVRRRRQIVVTKHVLCTMPRLRGSGGPPDRLSAHHRKPGLGSRAPSRGVASGRSCSPSLTFRAAYDALGRTHGERADVEYVRLLHLAAPTSERGSRRGASGSARRRRHVRLRHVQAEVPQRAVGSGLRLGPGTCSSRNVTSTCPAPAENRRRHLRPAAVLPVRCCPGPAEG